MSCADRSSSRNGTAVRVLAVHTTEGTSYTAAGLRDAAWWTGSSHAIADTSTLLTPTEGCVPYARASWTLRSGNPWSENIELVALAGWSRVEWLARPGLLDRCARWLADRAQARGIPLVKLTPQQYRAGHRGVIGHRDHTVGYSDGTHWDPGPRFPWDAVLTSARAYANGTTAPTSGGFLMGLNDDQQAELYNRVMWNLGAPGDTVPVKVWGHQVDIAPGTAVGVGSVLVDVFHQARQAAALAGQALAAIGGIDGADVDEAALAAALAPLVATQTQQLTDGDLERIATAVADEQARRQQA